MIHFDGISFNERNSRRILTELGLHNPAHSELTQDQVPARVSRCCFMSALAQLSGLAFFPRVAEFCDGSLQARCDARFMARGFFMPLCREGPDTLIVAVANPWSQVPDAYLGPRFPELAIVRIVTLASEITRSITAPASNKPVAASGFASTRPPDHCRA